MSNHAQRGHARLAPSASKRWIECSGSIRMSQGIADKSSSYADEGSAAHELGQHCLNTGHEPSQFAGWFVNLDGENAATKFIPLAKAPRCHEIDDEMVDGVTTYVEYCNTLRRSKATEWSIEEWLTLEYLGVEGLDGGTGDFVCYDPVTQTLDVVDLKYGRGVPVDPRENTQGLCYALGAVRRYHNRGLRKLRITIVQPRCPHPDGPVRTWECDVVDLLEFEADLKAAALATIEASASFEDMGEGGLELEWRGANLKAGDWCKFCPAAATCPTKREQALAIANAEFSALGELEVPVVMEMSPEKMGEVLREADQLEDWIRRVKEHAHHEATHGRMPAGFKLVAKRATRKWRDEQLAVEILKAANLTKDQIYTEPKLRSPSQVEAHMPGKNKAARAKLLEPYVSKDSSGTVLAPEHDPRPAVKADASEFEEVN